MAGFLQLGNDLYTGKRSFDFVGKRRIWFIAAALLIALSVLAPVVRGGFELGIEFTGGSEFIVSGSEQPDQSMAAPVVAEHSSSPAKVAVLGDGSVRVQTDPLDEAANAALRQQLAEVYGVSESEVAVSTIGPSWGADITRQMSIGLVVFLVIAATLMSLYFRTWKMSVAALAGLAFDLVVTAGVYAITGVEVTPATVIGFLTILGYSLYDAVVVFDKIRENVAEHAPEGSRTYGELVNLAVNQTLVRSINTSVVALLPVGAILFIGSALLGAGTLRDISLALFIGILVGALSTIFIASPLYAVLRSREPGIVAIDSRIRARRGEQVEELPLPEASSGTTAGKRGPADPDEERRRRASAADTAEPWELAEADRD